MHMLKSSLQAVIVLTCTLNNCGQLNMSQDIQIHGVGLQQGNRGSSAWPLVPAIGHSLDCEHSVRVRGCGSASSDN
eukprot:365267-Chlamydomonas_euryale.AAC.2